MTIKATFRLVALAVGSVNWVVRFSVLIGLLSAT